MEYKYLNKALMGLVISFFFVGIVSAIDLVEKDYYIDDKVVDLQVKEFDDDAFHLFTHGKPSKLLIEGEWKNANQIKDWLKTNKKLSNKSHLNIYGCEFAKGPKGLAAVSYLQSELGVSISASDDITGVDGDWDLEIGVSKEIEGFDSFKGNLQCVDPDMYADNCDFDGDGILNGDDLDDDNDGVLDVVECPEPILTGPTNSFGYQDAILHANHHSAMYLADDGNLYTWGRDAGIDGGDLRDGPVAYGPFPGDLLAFTGGGSQGAVTQFILTTEGLYASGAANQVIANTEFAGDDLAEIDLPAGVTPGDIVDIEATLHGLHILTSDGLVHTKLATSASNRTYTTYGDGTTARLTTVWKSNNALPDGQKIVQFKANYNAVFGVTDQGRLYAWGRYIYDGDGNGPITSNVPIEITPPAGVTVTQVALTDNFGVSTPPTLTFAVLGTNGRVYTIGSGHFGALGNGTTNASSSTWQSVIDEDGAVVDNAVNISGMSNDDRNTNFSLLTDEGGVLSWGYNALSTIGVGNSNASISVASVPMELVEGSITSGNIIAVANGGHITPVFTTTGFCGVGHNAVGALGAYPTDEPMVGNNATVNEYICYDNKPVLANPFVDNTCDTDGDGIPNNFDLDSDDDGCSDSFEAGVTTQGGPTFQFDGPFGDNGFDNTLETDDTADANYTDSYTYGLALDGIPCPDCCPANVPIEVTSPAPICSDGFVNTNLADYVDTTAPDDTELKFSTNSSPDSTSYHLGGSIVTESGNYYAFYEGKLGDDPCYSATKLITISIEEYESPGTDATETVCLGSTATLNFIDLLGADQGGTATETTSSGADISDITDVDFSAVTLGTYTFEYTTNTGTVCPEETAVLTVIVKEITISASASSPNCPGGMDGSITATVSGSAGTVVYDLVGTSNETGDASGEYTGLVAGTYMVSATDGDGCMDMMEVMVEDPAAATLTTKTTLSSCNDFNEDREDGMIVATATGVRGTAMYEIYEGTDASGPVLQSNTTGTFTGLAPGEYVVVFTDVVNGEACTQIKAEVLEEREPLTVSNIVVMNAICDDINGPSPDGAVTGFTLSGNQGDVTYSVFTSRGGTQVGASNETGMFDGLAVGSYVLRAEDENGCVEYTDFSIGAPDASKIIVMENTDVTCFDGQDGSFDLMFEGFDLPITLSYISELVNEENEPFVDSLILNDSTYTLSGLYAGVYQITARSSSKCTNTITDTIHQPEEIVSAPTIIHNTCKSDPVIGMITAEVIGGTGELTYEWGGGPTDVSAETTNVISVLDPGTYTLTVTDENSCVKVFEYEVMESCLEAVKTATVVPTDPQAGDVIQYEIVTTNTGDVNMTDIVVTDDIATVLSGGTIPTLVPGARATTVVEVTITQEMLDAGEVMNQATATGTDTSGTDVSDESDDGDDTNGDDNETTTPLTQNPELTVTKEVVKTATEAGDVIEYLIVVENTGNVTIDDIEVVDIEAEMADGTPYPSGVIDNISTLAPGISQRYTVYHTLTQEEFDSGDFANTATAEGEDPDGNPVTGTDTSTNDVDQMPSLSLEKETTFNDENGDGLPQEGETLTYDYTVTNTGNVSLSDVTVIENSADFTGTFTNIDLNGNTDLDADADIIEVATSPSDIPVGGEATVTLSYTITQADIESGMLMNQAVASGEGPDDGSTATVTDTSDDPNDNTNDDPDDDGEPDDPTVFTLEKMPAIEVIKLASFVDVNGEPGVQAGDQIEYEFTVSNTGNVILTDIMIIDDLVTVVGGPLDMLAVGAEDNTTFTALYTITQDDINAGEVENQATATGGSSGGTATDSSDDDATPDGDPDDDGDGDTDDDPTVFDIEQMPSLEVEKTVSPNDVVLAAGDEVTYTFTVTNTGNVPLQNIVITETAFGGAGTSPTISSVSPSVIPVGGTAEATAVYTLVQADIDAGGFDNQVTAQGEGPAPADGSDPVESNVDDSDNGDDGDGNEEDDPTMLNIVPAPGLSLTKDADLDFGSDGVANEGDVITFTFTIVNTGNITLSDIALVDPFPGIDFGSEVITGITLAPGEIEEITATYTITLADVNDVAGGDPIENNATVSAPDPNGGDDITDDGDSSTDFQPEASLELTKTSSLSTAGDFAVLGDIITYTFTIVNTGDVTIDDLMLDDTEFSGSGDFPDISDIMPTSIDPGATATASVDYVLTQEDIDAGGVNNKAEVMGEAPAGFDNPITDDSDDGDDTDGNLTDDETVQPIPENPCIQVDKSVMALFEGAPMAGDMVEYTIEVSNCGNVTLSDIVVSETSFSGAGTHPVFVYESSTAMSSETALLPGGVSTYSANYTLEQADIDAGMLMNEAEAEGTSPADTPVVGLSDDPADSTDEDTDGDGLPDDPTVIMFEEEPCIATQKSSSLDVGADGVANAGDEITYTVTVMNCGNVTLTGVEVMDPLLELGFESADMSSVEGLLKVGETATYVGVYAITQMDVDAGMVENNATASGMSPQGEDVSDTSDSDDTTEDVDDPNVTPIPSDPSIEIVKSASMDEQGDGISVGDIITYTFEVTNTGNVTLSDIVVEDDFFSGNGPLNIEFVSESETADELLVPNEVFTYMAEYMITLDDINAGMITNQAEAMGTAPDGEDVNDLSDSGDNVDPGDDDPTLVPLVVEPCISLSKVAELNKGADDVASVGDIVTYTYEVYNCGQITVEGIEIHEADYAGTNFSGTGDLTGTLVPNPTSIDPGETTMVTTTYMLTQADIDAGIIENTAIATGESPTGLPAEDTSDDDAGQTDPDENDPTELEIEREPCISVTKGSVLVLQDGADFALAGDKIFYDFTVSNCGNVTLTDVSLTESLFDGNGTPPMIVPITMTTLLPGQSVSTTAEYTLTQSDLDDPDGPIDNQAVATANSPAFPVQDFSDSENPRDMEDPNDFDDETTTPFDQVPCIEMIKSHALVNGENTGPGDEIVYTYEIINCGNTTLDTIMIVEDESVFTGANGLPVIDEIPESTTLSPFESITVEGRYTLSEEDLDSGQVTNSAMASAISPVEAANPVTDISDTGSSSDMGTLEDPTISTLPQNPCVELVKTSEPTLDGNGLIQVGSEITYSYEIVNCGNITLETVELEEVDDSFSGEGATPVPSPQTFSDVKVGDTVRAMASYIVEEEDIINGMIENQALASGEGRFGHEAMDDSDSGNANDLPGDDDPTVQEIPIVNCLTITKTESLDQGEDCVTTAGDVINYTYTLQNCGNLPIRSIQFDESGFTGSGRMTIGTIPTVLLGGQTVVVMGEYAISQADIDAGGVTNAVVVEGSTVLADLSDDASVFTVLEVICPSLACNDNVQVSLSSSCGGITPDMFLEGKLNLLNTIEITGEDGNTIVGTSENQSSPYVDENGAELNLSSFIGQEISYKITSSCDGNSCWGNALIEVKVEPKLDLNCDYELGFSVNDSLSITSDGTGMLTYKYPLPVDSDLLANLNAALDTITLGMVEVEYVCGEKICTTEVTINSINYVSDSVEIVISESFDAGDEFVLPLVFDVDDYVECEQMCSEAGTDLFYTVEEIKVLLNDACTPGLVSDPYFEDIAHSSDLCESALVIRNWFVDYELKGVVTTGLLASQAYRTIPIDLEAIQTEVIVKTDGTDYLDANGETVNRFELPSHRIGDNVLDCDDDYSATMMGAGVPRIWNYNANVPEACDTLVVEYMAVTSIEDELISFPDADGNDIWSILTVVNKEKLVKKFCGTDDITELRRFLEMFDTIDNENLAVGDVVELVEISYQLTENSTVTGDVGLFEYTDLLGDVYAFDDVDSLAHFITDEVYTSGIFEGAYIFNTLADVAVGLEDVDGYWEKLDDDVYCNLHVNYTDSETLEGCGDGFKLIRTWEIVDWCTGELLKYDQIIELGDRHRPTVYSAPSPADTITMFTSPWTCEADLSLIQDLVTFKDNCDDSVAVTLRAVGSTDRLTSGVYTVIYTGTDDCSNSRNYTVTVEVKDGSAPIPVCQDEISVSLVYDQNDGMSTAKVFAKSFDNGSHDGDCSDVTFKVIRMEDLEQTVTNCDGTKTYTLPSTCSPETEMVDLGSPDDKGVCHYDGTNMVEVSVEADFVKFCCADMGQDNMVQFRVIDEAGNSNICMNRVRVVDKNTNKCEDSTIEVTCDMNLDDITAPPSLGACTDVSLLYEDSDAIGCGVGKIERAWIFDNNGNGIVDGDDTYACKTVIVLDEPAGLDPYSIKWPKHYDGAIVDGKNLECEDENEEVLTVNARVTMGDPFTCEVGAYFSEVEYCASECGSNIVYSREVDTVFRSPSCYTIFVKHQIIDWCTYVPNSDNEDEDNDHFEAIEDWSEGVCSSCELDGKSVSEDEAHVYMRYADVEKDGYYTYIQKIKVIDDTEPELNAPDTVYVDILGGRKSAEDIASECVGSGMVTASATDYCGASLLDGEDLYWTITTDDDDNEIKKGSEVTIPTIEGSAGDESVIEWVVRDGCGNVSLGSTVVVFRDMKAPTPVCIAGLTTAVMPLDGTVEIWAKDYDRGSFDNCTATEDLIFAIVPKGAEFDVEAAISGDLAARQYSCADLSNGPAENLDLYVVDSQGNYDHCSVTIIIEDTRGVCEGVTGSTAMISGSISNEKGDMVESAMVSIHSNQAEYPRQYMTDQHGAYAFEDATMYSDYQLSVEKDEKYLTGVSTIDLVLIQKHLLGLQELGSPYKMIAADANGNGSLSTVDIVLLRRLILGISKELSGVPAWRFVDASHDLSADPFSYSEHINIADLSNVMENQNFIATKTGDVNVSANTLEERANGVLQLSVADTYFERGQKVEIAVRAENFTEVYGYQVTLDHAGLELVDVESGALELGLDNIGVFEESLTMSWNNANGVSTDEVLFTLVFDATSDGLISESIGVTDELTHSEAYTGDQLDRKLVSLAVSTEEAYRFELHQNSPNPFKNSTSIGFVLPRADRAVLRVFDISGKVLYELTDDYAAGYNRIDITNGEIMTKGVLYYQLQVGTQLATKKMVVLE